MQKKAQVTVFIILGLIIAIILFATFYFFGESLLAKSKTSQLTQAQLIPLKEHVESCILVSLNKNFELIKRNAFFFSPSSYTTDYGGAKVNYLIYPDNAVNKLNSLEAVQDELSSNIEKDLQSCSFDKFNLDIKPDKKAMKAETAIAENKIIVTLNYPIKVSKGQTSLELKGFSVSKETDLGLIHSITNDIVAGELQGEFDQYKYTFEHPESRIDKFNLDINNAVFLVTSNKEQDYVLFAVGK